jgi:hypothetical protein
MLTYAADFWPLFWAIVGGGAVLTVLMSLLVATFSPSWFGRPGRKQAGSHAQLTPAGPGEEPAHLPRAA